ncbi:MAG: Rid family hydrolase, partial [Deltaproteobacteria bacterium]|nr:Rid family hydrolase [Deltaproteobacteria bacterium]
MKMIATDKAPKAVGHYSQAVEAGNFLFLSGQIPIDPKTNDLCQFEGDVARQAELVLKNI